MPVPRSSRLRIGRHALVAPLLVAAGCRGAADCPAPSEAERLAIADTLAARIAGAYAFAGPDTLAGLLSLYPAEGPVVSAAGGRLTTNRAQLAGGLRQFWENVVRNMREPRWVWDDVHVDVLGRDAAVLTGTYRIPHRTPAGAPHVIGGAWTAVFSRRDGRWVIIQEHLSDATAAPPAPGGPPAGAQHRH